MDHNVFDAHLKKNKSFDYEFFPPFQFSSKLQYFDFFSEYHV